MPTSAFPSFVRDDGVTSTGRGPAKRTWPMHELHAGLGERALTPAAEAIDDVLLAFANRTRSTRTSAAEVSPA